MSETTKFLLSESEIPTHWVNLLPDLPGEPLPPLSPRTGQPAGPRGPDADLPDGADRPRGLDGARDRGARGGAARLRPLAADAAVPGPAPRAGARHAGAHLLQVRGRLPGRLAQAQHRRAAGLRERAGRDEEARDRDRRGAVGLLAGLRVLAVRARVRGLHGRLQLRPEALPPLDDADLGRDRAPLALGPHGVRPRERAAPDRLAGDRDLRGRRDRRPGPRLQLLARLSAQPRAAAPDRDRAGGHPADGAGGRAARRDRRLRRRRLELRRAGVPVPARAVGRALRRRRAGRLPDAHARPATPTTSATPWG